MENKDISQMVLQKIKESGIKPISKNVFNSKRVLFWSLVGLSIVIGAISFSVILSVLFNNDWYLYNKLGFNFIFKSLPYFWFIFLAIFTILGDLYYRQTLLGYRHRTVTIVGVYVILTIIFGSILHVVGVGRIVEESLSENVPIYHGMMFDKSEFWSHPEDGFISGQIILVDGNLIKIIDFKDNIWIVMLDNAFISNKVQIRKGEFIKIIGDKNNQSIFKAEQIRPWIGNKINQDKNINNRMR